jgi:hypothetical protein
MRNWPLIRFGLYETFFDNIIKLVAKNHIFIYIKNSYLEYYKSYYFLCLELYSTNISDIDQVNWKCRLQFILFCIYYQILYIIIRLYFHFKVYPIIKYSVFFFEESIDQTLDLLIVYEKFEN